LITRKGKPTMPDLQSAMEDFLAAMPLDDFRCLVARVRPPDEPLPLLGAGDVDRKVSPHEKD
jgi:hypothetical protein